MKGFVSWLDPDQLRIAMMAALPRILSALVVLVAMWVLLRATRPLLKRLLVRAHFAPALVEMLVDGLFKGVIVIVALITAASQVGINVSAALAGLGVAGIALGFAAQETVANMIAGFLVFWDRPFKIGDYISTQGQYGKVQDITMRTTRIRTMENAYIVIPNKQIIGELLVNHSMYGEIRINVPIGIAYSESIAQARSVLLAAVARMPSVLATPPAEVVAFALGDSSVNLQVRVWIPDAALERPTQFAVLETCKSALDAAGIEIPYPHLQLSVDAIGESALKALAALPRAERAQE